MSLIEIRHWNGNVLHSIEADSIKAAVELLLGRGADLSGAVLSGAVLSGAVLRYADLSYAALRGADLSGAALRGADLSGAVLRYADLSGAVLRYADLSGADLSGAVLSGADLSGAVLSGAVLSGAVLSGADLSGAVLSGAVLSGADLSGAVLSGAEYYKVSNLHTKILAAIEAGGTLEMSTWHTCETAHCRAGWAVHLAGNAGRLLESIYGSEMAGALIHQASCPWLEKVPDFHCGNEAALKDIKTCAAKEKELASVSE